MKRQGYLFEGVSSFAALYKAALKALRGHKAKPEAAEYLYNIDRETWKLQEELLAGTYRPRPYRYFEIFEPKQRTISVASFRDRVVHHALVAQLEPIFERSFIFHSYATRKGKGSLAAVRQAQKCLRQNPWYLKLDIRKYFDSIDHLMLMELIGRKIKDPRIMALAGVILETSTASSDNPVAVGLPIGNLNRQFFANVYLDPLDHYVSETLKAPYLRYMDDMLLFAQDKSVLKIALPKVEAFLGDKLKLHLKKDAILLNNGVHGLPFLGFRIFPDLIRIKKENLRRLEAKIRLRQRQYRHGLIGETELYRSVQSVIAFGRIADSRSCLQKLCHDLG